MQFVPARREAATTLVAFAGASGCGKTFSALRLAKGLAGEGGRIAFVDTEARRALHYADQFDFDHLDLAPPFRPDRFLEAVQLAERGRYAVVVIDSFSHEYEGEGGIVEWAAEMESNGVKSPGNWAAPKAAHKRLIQRLLQARCHLVFCLRAEEKLKIEKVLDERTGREKTVVVPQGFVPICEKRFMYEMTASFVMYPGKPGIPDPTKLQEQHRRFFPDGQPITEATGEALAAWAGGKIAGGTGFAREPAAKRPVYGSDGEVLAEVSKVEDWLEAYRRAMGEAEEIEAKERIAVANLETLRAFAGRYPDRFANELQAAEALAERVAA